MKYYNKLFNHAASLRDLILDLIFPIECLSCGESGELLCRDCFYKLKFKNSQYCLHCKNNNRLGQFCHDCKKFYYLDGIWIASDYEEKIIAKLIKNLKYRFTGDVAKFLGKFLTLFMHDLISKNIFTKFDLAEGIDKRKLEKAKNLPMVLLGFNSSIMIPVPLSKKRKRWRGFNQSQSIAEVVAKQLKLKLSINELVRIKHKKPQAKLNEIERKSNILDCFAWRGSNLSGRNIILVDDVITTGATLNECAKVLKKSGAGEVWGLVVAKG